MELLQDLSLMISVIGILATLVSVITEVTKSIGFSDKIPTSLQVLVNSLLVTPISLLALLSYYGIVIEWFMIFASFFAAFVVAFVSMYGWEKFFEISERLKR